MTRALRFLFGTALLATSMVGLGQSAAAPDLGSDPNLSASNMKNVSARIGIDFQLSKSVPKDVRLTDDKGNEVVFGNLLGQRPVLLIPMFFNCQTACPLETDNLLKVLVKEEKQNQIRSMGAEAAGINIADLRRERRLLVGRDFDVVMLSIHPLETPKLAHGRRMRVNESFAMGWEDLSQEQQKTNMESIDRGFHYLVGKPEEVKKLTDAIGFRYYYNAEKNQMNHVAASAMLTPAGKISSYITGTDFATKVLANGVELASREEIGVAGDKFLFGCVMIDPVTGKTTLVFNRILTIACVLTMVVIATSIVVMNRRHPDRIPVRKITGDPLDGGNGAA